MGIEEDFYATVKLKSGEEIFAKVAASEEEDRTMLIVSNPIIVCEIKGRGGIVGYKIEPWLKTTTEDMFIINLDNVLTLSESSDIEMISMYQSYLREYDKTKKNQSKISRKMGYLANVNDAKEILEKLYKNS
jgi:altronate dehydratase